MFLFPLESCENYGYGLTKSSSLPDHKKERSKTYHHRALSEKKRNLTKGEDENEKKTVGAGRKKSGIS